MDVLWYHLQSIKNPIGNNKRFNIFFEVGRIVLLITHSNAAIECLFCLANKSKNESSDRNRLDQGKILSFTLAVMFDRPDTSSALSFSLMKNYWVWQKKAVVKYNQKHSN